MKRIIMYSLGIAGLTAAGLVAIPSFVQAQGGNGNANGNGGGYGYRQSIGSKAKALGISEDELRTQLETKTLLQIAEKKGISVDQLHATMQKAAQARWEANGLNQTEIDARLKNMEERQANCDGTGNGNGGGQHYRANQ
ncbi:MAG TPA: hypothetical protein VFD55_01570 [Candidatus Angelobacter sp.]|nr:hypothetical protein [Candidatus Angelobacter sp.]